MNIKRIYLGILILIVFSILAWKFINIGLMMLGIILTILSLMFEIPEVIKDES